MKVKIYLNQKLKKTFRTETIILRPLPCLFIVMWRCPSYFIWYLSVPCCVHYVVYTCSCRSICDHMDQYQFYTNVWDHSDDTALFMILNGTLLYVWIYNVIKFFFFFYMGLLVGLLSRTGSSLLHHMISNGYIIATMYKNNEKCHFVNCIH